MNRDRPTLISFVTVICGVILLPVVCFHFSLFSWANNGMAGPTFLLSDLRVTLSQESSTSPPTIQVSVKNSNPSTTVTFLKWNSPLDPAALGLGLVSITPTGSSEPVSINGIKISRPMPPGEESLVSLSPGESTTDYIVLREPVVPSDVWDKGIATVDMKGRWMAVWPGLTKDDVLQDPQKLKGVGGGQKSSTGEWASNSIKVGKT